MKATKVILFAKLHGMDDPRADAVIFAESIREAVERNLIPRMVTTFSLSVELERHAALQFAMDLRVGDPEEVASKELQRQRQMAFKALVRDREQADHKLCFSIFEIIFNTEFEVSPELPNLRRQAIQLGKAALDQDERYLEPMLRLLLNAIVKTKDDEQKMITNACYVVQHILQQKGFAATVVWARWLMSTKRNWQSVLSWRLLKTSNPWWIDG